MPWTSETPTVPGLYKWRRRANVTCRSRYNVGYHLIDHDGYWYDLCFGMIRRGTLENPDGLAEWRLIHESKGSDPIAYGRPPSILEIDKCHGK